MKTTSLSWEGSRPSSTLDISKLHPKNYRWLGQGLNLLSMLHAGFSGRLAYQLLSTPRRTALKSRDKVLLEAAWPISYKGKLGRIEGYMWGDGPPVLLLHGWQAHSARWRAYIPRLVDAGYSVFAFDAPAHGNSKGISLGILEYRNVVMEFLEFLPPVQAIIGHSLGAMAAVMALGKSSCISPHQLVLMGTFSSPVNLLHEFANYLKLNSEIVHSIRNYVEKKSGENVDDLCLHKTLQQLDITKLMVIHDKDDPIAPVNNAFKLAEAHPNAELILTVGKGHELIGHAVVDKVVNFVSNVQALSE